MERRSASGATSSFPIISNDVQTRYGTEDIHARLGYDMTRIRTLIALSLVMITAGFAQQQSTLEISLSSGYVLPVSPMTFARYWTMQAGGSLSAGMALSPSMVIQASVDYYRFTMNAQGVAENFDTQYMRTIWIFSDVSQHPSAELSSIVTVSAGVRVSSPGFSGTFSPYVLAGAGAMFSSIAEIALQTTSVLDRWEGIGGVSPGRPRHGRPFERHVERLRRDAVRPRHDAEPRDGVCAGHSRRTPAAVTMDQTFKHIQRSLFIH